MTQSFRAADDASSSAASLSIGGVTPFSTVDWPGKLAAVAFLTGCPWRCPYCQNRLLWEHPVATATWDELRDLMVARRGLLDGIVFSGGEPLGQPGLAAAVHEMHDIGFAVGLHTGGAWPERLRAILPELAWVGFDVKAPWDAYERVTRMAGSGGRARESLEALLESGIDMEARTTWHPSLLSPDSTSSRSGVTWGSAACAIGPCRPTARWERTARFPRRGSTSSRFPTRPRPPFPSSSSAGRRGLGNSPPFHTECCPLNCMKRMKRRRMRRRLRASGATPRPFAVAALGVSSRSCARRGVVTARGPSVALCMYARASAGPRGKVLTARSANRREPTT